jgi:hypothetical protein
MHSPNVGNLQVGKGIVSFQRDRTGAYKDLGNVTSFKVTPSVETLEHFSSREGTRKKDLEIVIEQGGEVVMVMEEFTAHNLSLMLMGTYDEGAMGGPEVEILAISEISGALRFVGTNDIGPKVTIDLYNVSFQPSGDLEMISDEWNNMEVTGQLLVAPEGDANAGKFGLAKFTNVTLVS